MVCKVLGEKTHHFTLLDGEMIIDTLPDSQKQERRYLIYDMIAINQVSVIEVGSYLLSVDSSLFLCAQMHGAAFVAVYYLCFVC